MKSLIPIFIAVILIASCKALDPRTAGYGTFEEHNKIIEIEGVATNHATILSMDKDATRPFEDTIDYLSLLLVVKLDQPDMVTVYYPDGVGEEEYSPTERRYVKPKYKKEPEYFRRYYVLLKNKRALDEFRSKGVTGPSYDTSLYDFKVISDEGESYYVKGKIAWRDVKSEQRFKEPNEYSRHPTLLASKEYIAFAIDPSLLVRFVRKNGEIISKEVLYDARRGEQ